MTHECTSYHCHGSYLTLRKHGSTCIGTSQVSRTSEGMQWWTMLQACADTRLRTLLQQARLLLGILVLNIDTSTPSERIQSLSLKSLLCMMAHLTSLQSCYRHYLPPQHPPT